ncbi:MAG TPA: iron-sulfur cluster insertion protein ErpA [Alphaproteobacteria bacterium]|jgi:iron-sulfur cluster assembly accessory protein|nr:iron-sulfur cluster insertion protein ErpA [Alphaproteobacteria bacterium]HAM48171.1 iron-sulfur cluster insertion protein ErpA [Alphaproteobacteria bacterium]HBA44023.1 iron-sulfur cluster insertion protein ErpA [Alphaproteobacteria bacterium]HBC54203.1 iron-sulfur cluster insertion protein ErpA [Alphaproteobacteria bacterium]HBF97616.1 iron-sulfur cluster insertion protein ErpA [Alphaproteobacteria bacterium]
MQTSDATITISEKAARRVAELAAGEPEGVFLRVTVTGGGCSGFQYSFSFDDAMTADDRSFTRDGVKVVIDEMSLMYLEGSEIDYVDDLIGAAFRIHNPNATASCGCGTSFAV